MKNKTILFLMIIFCFSGCTQSEQDKNINTQLSQQTAEKNETLRLTAFPVDCKQIDFTKHADFRGRTDLTLSGIQENLLMLNPSRTDYCITTFIVDKNGKKISPSRNLIDPLYPLPCHYLIFSQFNDNQHGISFSRDILYVKEYDRLSIGIDNYSHLPSGDYKVYVSYFVGDHAYTPLQRPSEDYEIHISSGNQDFAFDRNCLQNIMKNKFTGEVSSEMPILLTIK